MLMVGSIVLGALHGLEPGHSKTLMASVIVALRGTVPQAILLGLSATISHSIVVWGIALLGLSLGETWPTVVSEPYFQIASGLIVIFIGAGLLFRIFKTCHHHHHDIEPQLLKHQLQTSDQKINHWQLMVFGLTGGLIPCPAAITVLLLCLQLEKVTLGAGLVVGFSVGLALTLVASGVFAALGLAHAEQKWPKLGRALRRAPYFSGLLILSIGLYMVAHGSFGLHALH